MGKERISDRVIQVNDVNIGSYIREFRRNAGYRQIDMVGKLQLSGIDISVYSYNRIEKGTQNPTVSLLLTLCDIFDCNMDDLFGRQSP